MQMPEWMQRTELLLGTEKMERLQKAHVLVVGTGGVGAAAAEMLVRAGVGHLTMVDADVVQPSNINRQLCALHSTVGREKVDVLRQRFLDISPELDLESLSVFLTEENVLPLLEAKRVDFVVDAIDTIAPKCALILESLRRRIPIVSSMGAGAKTDLTQIRYADIWETYHCGLSKAVRSRMKKADMRVSLPVVFCTQQADVEAVVQVDGERNKKTTTGTVSYMPVVFGCYLASYVLNKL